MSFDPYAPLTGKTMQSQLYSSPFADPPGCGPGRTESSFRMMMNGKIYTFITRDRIIPEDPYLSLVKAAIFSVRRAEEHRGTPPSRAVRDFLIKTNLSI